MSWLFAPRLRPLVLFAAVVSLVLNIAMLMPALYMIEIFDRVFASRSVETLVMLSAFAILALGLAYCADAVRACALGYAGRLLDRTLSPLALRSVLAEAAGPARRVDNDVLRDVGKLRAFLAGSGVHALFDAPWLPVYLIAIVLMHPLLGATAAVGAFALVALGMTTHKLTRMHAVELVSRSRSAANRADMLLRNA